MRKRILEPTPTTQERAGGDGWLDLGALATIEVTSEDAAHPVEGALEGEGSTGWRAGAPGEQTLRIRFDEPQRLSRIHLVIVEDKVARTQELALAWASDPDGAGWREIVRQQWNFSPTGSTRETEDYRLELSGVRAVQLTLRPDVGGGAAIASIARLRLA